MTCDCGCEWFVVAFKVGMLGGLMCPLELARGEPMRYACTSCGSIIWFEGQTREHSPRIMRQSASIVKGLQSGTETNGQGQGQGQGEVKAGDSGQRKAVGKRDPYRRR